MPDTLLATSSSRKRNLLQRTARPFRIGFVPLLDAAPIVVAHYMGLFTEAGVPTTLLRQPGWACVRDKMLTTDLDVAHAPGGFLFAMNSNAASAAERFVTGFITSAQGNAITLSSQLYKRGVRDARDLTAEVRTRRGEPLTFGIVSPYSTHSHLLRSWLVAGGLRLGEEVRIVSLPPQQMVTSLAAGHLDGFCAGEPWNSLAAADGHGWVAADSARLAPMHPEKVLLVHEDFAKQHHAEHMAMLHALQAACLWCSAATNRPALAKLLANKIFTDTPASVIAKCLASPLAPVFSAPGLHDPTPEKALWLLKQMRQHKLLPAKVEDAVLLGSFRSDLHAGMAKTS